MGIEDLFSQFAELDELRGQMRRARAFQTRSRISQARRIAELESGLGRVALLARALAELCVEKGAITREELRAKLLAVDFADGAQDERLDPRVALPGERKLAELEPVSPHSAPKPGRRPRKRRR